MQKRHHILASSVVLWQLLLCISLARGQADTSITFKGSGTAPTPPKSERKIEAAINVGIGLYDGESADVSTLPIQPTAGVELLAYPGGWPTFLFGVHFGFTNPMTSSVVVGIRQPLVVNQDGIWRLSGDIGAIFFDEEDRKEPIGLGARAALIGRSTGSIPIEYRLATEFRGILANDADPTTSTARWWVGAEVGVAFTLTSPSQEASRKEIVRAQIMPIATAEEIMELDEITSSYRVDEWLEMFWAKRDLTPKTVTNEARIEYERRAAIADKSYSRGKRLGVTTDPGRAMVLYGEPDYVETEGSVVDENYRYEMWIYTSRIPGVSPAVILFEVSGARDWRQMYSNIPGEVSGTVPANLPTRMAKWL